MILPMQIRTEAALLALAPLGACAMTPPTPPAFQTPSAYTETQFHSVDKADISQWWLGYNDPQLSDLIASALTAGTDARTANAVLREARAVRAQQIWSLFPQGSISGSARKSSTDIISSKNASPATLASVALDTDSQALNFNVSWELDLFGRIPAAELAADSAYRASRLRNASTRAAIAAAVADSLFVARSIAAQLEDARQSLRIQTQVFETARLRFTAGLSPRTDVDRVDADRMQSQAEVERLEAELKAVKRSLLTLTGRGSEAVDAIKIEAVLGAPPTPPSGVPSDLLERRPDVREARERFNSAAGARKVAQLALFPSFTLQPGAGVTNTSSSGVDIRSGFWALGVGMTLPVLDRPRLVAQAKQRSIQVEEAAIAYEATTLNAISEADQSLVRLSADLRRVELLSNAERQARSLFEAQQTVYRAGLIDLQTFLDAERVWRAARTNLTAGRRDALRRSVTLYQALGGGWTYTDFSPNAQGQQK